MKCTVFRAAAETRGKSSKISSFSAGARSQWTRGEEVPSPGFLLSLQPSGQTGGCLGKEKVGKGLFTMCLLKSEWWWGGRCDKAI